MAKRKRGDRDERPPADVGLGATLAHMRGEAQPDDATTTPANGDEEGWTVVGGTKRRRKERGPHDDQNRHRASNSPPSTRSPDRSQHTNGQGKRKESSPPPQQDATLDNPFAGKGAQLGTRASPTNNPFVTYKAGSEQSSENMTREERRKERKLQRSYPAIEHSHHARLNSHVKITDLQSLVLYLLADGNAPQWSTLR